MEGLPIILDKSSLQMFSAPEIEVLCRHYFLVVPPILLTEMAGDLYCRDDRSVEETNRKVQVLANKILTFSACKQIDHRDLRDHSLLGNGMRTSFKPVIQPTALAEGSNGQSIAYISETLEMKMIHDWQRGRFQADDYDYAKVWKETSKPDLNSYKSQLLPIPGLENLTSLKAICDEMDYLSRNVIDDQWFLIDWFCNRVCMPHELKQKVEDRWKFSRVKFCDFAPYAYYCFLIEQVFYQGLASGLIPTSTNAKSYVDLQYAYYFPYTRVFSSNDRLHKQLWLAFANHEQQLFVTGSELKDDLQKIYKHFEVISEAERNDLRRITPHPPAISQSFTFAAYETMIRLGVVGSIQQIDRTIERTKEERDALVERILTNYQKVCQNIQPDV